MEKATNLASKLLVRGLNLLQTGTGTDVQSGIIIRARAAGPDYAAATAFPLDDSNAIIRGLGFVEELRFAPTQSQTGAYTATARK